MKKWLCIVCGLIYDEAEGWPSDGIEPGTRWEDVPEDWGCPDCGVGKADFEMIEITAEDEPAATSVEEMLPAAVAVAAPAAPVSPGPLVIIGSGHAGYGLVEAVRARDAEREIHVFTADDGGAYSKPELSNALALDKNADSLLDESALAVEQRLNIRVHAFCPVERIDAERQCITTRLGDMPYGDLVLATGARPIRIPVAGDQDALLAVNNRADYRAMRRRLDELGQPARVAIIGDGLIGCEFANDLAQAGHAVSVIGLAEQPLPRLLTEGGGRALQTALSALGVRWYLQRSVAAVQAEEGGYHLTLTDGTPLDVDLVVSAVGLAPNIDLAVQAGIACGRGVDVDEYLATSIPHIHAIGDAVEIHGQLLPYLAPINAGLRALATTLCGTPTPVSYPTMPVMVKTPAAPICVVVPPAAYRGHWHEERHVDGLQAACYDSRGVLMGFALVGETAMARRSEWLRHCGQADAA